MNASTYGAVFGGERVSFPTGTDELYHLRRIWYDTVHFPAHLDLDSYANFPHGSRAIWPFLHDWLTAGLARALVGARDQAAVERVAAWVPAVLGAVNALFVARLGASLAGWPAGLLAGALLALLPAHAHNARLGMVDHHVAIALVGTWLMSCAARTFGPDAGRRWIRRSAETALAFTVGMLLSPAFLFPVLVFQAFGAAQVLLSGERETARSRARALALALAFAAAGIAPFCLGQRWPQLPPLSPLVLSAFQPLWFGAGAVALALLAALWSHGRAGATPARRLASAAALAATGLAAAFALAPSALADLIGASRWFSKGDEFMHLVGESTPILFPGGRFALGLAHRMLSWAVWTLPAAALWLVWQRRRTPEAAALGFVSTWAAGFGAATLMQQRFADQFALGFVLVMAAAVAELGRLRTRFGRGLAAAAVAGLAVALVPCLDYFVNEAGGRVGQDVVAVARWMRGETPATTGWLDASERPEYGVLAAWNDGHRVRYYAERPVVQDNFGAHANYGAPPPARGFELAREYYRARDEEQAVAIARELRVRYVLATAAGSGQDLVIEPDMMTARLRRWLGSEPAPSRGAGLPALGRHRLVHVRGSGEGRVALFEIVPGALVSGTAPPGRPVRFELALAGAGGGSLLYRATALASATGRYALRLPYATQPMPHSDLRSGGPYRVRCGPDRLTLELSEDDVREGRSRTGPDCR